MNNLESELAMLRTSAQLAEEEGKRKDDVLQQTTHTMSMVEREHHKLVKVTTTPSLSVAHLVWLQHT